MKAVTFDVGATLLYTRPSVPEAFVAAAARWGIDVALEDAVLQYTRVEQYYEQRYQENGDFWCDPDGSVRIWIEMYELFCSVMGIRTRVTEIVDELCTTYVTSGGWAYYDDVLPALHALKSSGLKLGVISNWGLSLPQILEELGLKPYFDVIVPSASVGSRKPQAEIFLHAFKELGVSSDECIHVGDLADCDGWGASNVGAKPLIIDRHQIITDCSYPTISSLEQIADYLW